MLRPKAGEYDPLSHSKVSRSLQSYGRLAQAVIHTAYGRKPSPKICTVVAGHAKTLNVCGETVSPPPRHEARLVEADIRLGCPFGHARKSVKNSQRRLIRILMFQLWERSMRCLSHRTAKINIGLIFRGIVIQLEKASKEICLSAL